APLLLRILGVRRIRLTLRMPYAGTLQRVAEYYLRTGLPAEKLSGITTEEALAIMAVHGKSIRRAVACALLNGWLSGWLLTPLMAWYIKWHMKEEYICALMDMLITSGGVADFMTTTRLIRSMKITAPKLGQKTKGS